MKSALNKSIEFEHYYQNLGNNGSESLFLTMKDVFMLALIIGGLEKQNKPFGKIGGEPIKLNIFSPEDRNIMDLIALSVTDDIDILTKEQEDKKYNVIEEYANGGMEILVNNITKPVPSLDNFKKFISTFSEGDNNIKKVDISDLINDAINNI